MNGKELLKKYKKEILSILKREGYTKVDVQADITPKTYYTHRGHFTIVVSRNLSFAIVSRANSYGLGTFLTEVTKNGKSYGRGTYIPDFFFPRLFAFFRGEVTEQQIIDEIGS